MKLKKISLLLPVLLLATGLHATSFSFQSEEAVTLFDKNGATINTVNASLGLFTAGFTPTANNVSEWSAHWLTGLNSDGIVAPAENLAWVAGFDLADNSVIPAASQLYLWVYDSRNALADTTGWILLTNSSWATVVASAFDISSYDYSFGTGITTVVGSLNLAGGSAQLAAVGASAVPEPSTYAAIFGAGALGFALWRKRRARTQPPRESEVLG